MITGENKDRPAIKNNSKTDTKDQPKTNDETELIPDNTTENKKNKSADYIKKELQTSNDNDLETSCDNDLETSCDNDLETSCDNDLETSCDGDLKNSCDTTDDNASQTIAKDEIKDTAEEMSLKLPAVVEGKLKREESSCSDITSGYESGVCRSMSDASSYDIDLENGDTSHDQQRRKSSQTISIDTTKKDVTTSEAEVSSEEKRSEGCKDCNSVSSTGDKSKRTSNPELCGTSSGNVDSTNDNTETKSSNDMKTTEGALEPDKAMDGAELKHSDQGTDLTDKLQQLALS